MAKNKAQTLYKEKIGAALEKVSAIFAVLFLSVFPLVMGKGKYTNITETKFKAFVILSLLYLASVVAVAIYYRFKYPVYRDKSVTVKERLIALVKTITIPQWIIIAYFIWCSLSALLSLYGRQTFIGMSRYEGWLSMALYALIFFLMSRFGKFRPVYVYAMAVSATIMGLITLAQELGYLPLYPEGYNYFNSGFMATIGNKDCYAGIVSIYLPLLLISYVLMERNPKEKIDFRYLNLIPIFLLIYTGIIADVDTITIALLGTFLFSIIFMLDSRLHVARLLQGIAPVIVGLAFLKGVSIGWNGILNGMNAKAFMLLCLCAAALFAAGLFLELFSKKKYADTRLVQILIALSAVICIVASFTFIKNYAGEYKLFYEASQLLNGNVDDSLGSGRGLIWKSAVEIIKENGLFGSGPGTFFGEFAPYNEAWQARGSSTVVDFAHNDFLQIGVCTGVVGMIIYIAFCISLFACVFIKKINSVKIILFTGVLGYLIYSFFVFSIAIVSPMAWILMGLLVSETFNNIKKENC